MWVRGLCAAGASTVLLLVAACGGSEGGAHAEPTGSSHPTGQGGRTIVVTFPILGAVVEELVDGEADVVVLVDGATDPHDFQPSARDAEAVARADLLVLNGLGLEGGVDGLIREAESAGVPVFVATDHITVRSQEADSHDHEGHSHDDGHDHGAEDPHFWMDPVEMSAVVGALSVELEGVGLDTADRAAAMQAELVLLDDEVRSSLASIPPERRVIVTSHESMGYFADRYGLEVVGVIVASMSSQASPSAGELSALIEEVDEHGVTVVFVEIGTSRAVAETIAEQTGAEVVELPSHNLGPDGTYSGFVRELSRRIASALRT